MLCKSKIMLVGSLIFLPEFHKCIVEALLCLHIYSKLTHIFKFVSVVKEDKKLTLSNFKVNTTFIMQKLNIIVTQFLTSNRGGLM